MKISDLKEEDIRIGLRVRSLVNYNKIGTIVSCEPPERETFWWIQWDGDDKPYSGFYWNDCECEIVE